MNEATPPNSALICASAWRRIGAALVDMLIGMSLSLLYLPLMRHAFEQRSTALLVACDLATATLNLFLVIRFGATPGKFVVLTNRRRRAIHDFIAGTYVVTLESWTRHHADSTDRALASVR